MDLASYHSSGAYILEVAPSDMWKICGPPAVDPFQHSHKEFPTTASRFLAKSLVICHLKKRNVGSRKGVVK